MFQVRLHGRGGQDVATMAGLLAVAAPDAGRHAQAFPGSGSEPMGAPVMSNCRIDDQSIPTNKPVPEPDALIIQDPRLLDLADLFAGLGRDSYVLINSVLGLGELGPTNLARGYHPDRWLVVSASSLAVTTFGRPLPGAPLLGGSPR